jgi:hypothetical protein
MPVFEDVYGKLWRFSEVEAVPEVPEPEPEEPNYTLRGVNLMDTRGCNACAYEQPNADEVIRRAQFFVGNGANFFRLCLSSYSPPDGRVNYDFDAPGYLDDIRKIAIAIEEMGAQVLVSLWMDDTFDEFWMPTEATFERHRKLALTLRGTYAWIGVCNEPTQNWNGAADKERWAFMQTAVDTIRNAGLSYYYENPIVDMSGEDNIAYETHVYGPVQHYDAQVTAAEAAGLEVLLGEFGPVAGAMTEPSALAVQDMALKDGIPSAAWVGHHRCGTESSMLVDNSNGGCGVGMDLELTDWGKKLAAVWATSAS